jgi:uncharacterized protein
MRRFIYIVCIPFLFIQACSFNKFFYNAVPDRTYKIENDEGFKEIQLINRNKDTITGLLLNPIPENAVKGTILLVHGNSGNIDRWVENARYLYNHGYRILVFDYEGYGKSTGKPTHRNVVSDSELFINYLFGHYGKILIWGISLGGNLAVNLAYRNSDKISALILEGAFTSHNAIARTKAPGILKPFVFLSVRSPYKSKNIIKKIHIPVIISHSTEDKIVPYSMGKRLFINANEPKFFLELQGMHCYGIINNRKEYLHLIDLVDRGVYDVP